MFSAGNLKECFEGVESYLHCKQPNELPKKKEAFVQGIFLS